MSNNESLKEKLNTLQTLAAKALVLRGKTKGEHDGNFLKMIFHGKKWKDTDLMLKVEMLAKIYSVARTTGTKKDEKKNEYLKENLKNLLDNNEHHTTDLFNTYKTNYEISKELGEILLDKSCGSREKDGETNTIISLLSKYGYYITNFQFPIYDNFARKGITALFKQDEFKALFKEWKKSHQQIELKKELTFFYKYSALLNKCSGLPKTQRIDSLDAFFWLYGIMQSTQSTNLANKTFWWSGTCGYVGSKEFKDWYRDAKKLMS